MMETKWRSFEGTLMTYLRLFHNNDIVSIIYIVQDYNAVIMAADLCRIDEGGCLI